MAEVVLAAQAAEDTVGEMAEEISVEPEVLDTVYKAEAKPVVALEATE